MVSLNSKHSGITSQKKWKTNVHHAGKGVSMLSYPLCVLMALTNSVMDSEFVALVLMQVSWSERINQWQGHSGSSLMAFH